MIFVKKSVKCLQNPTYVTTYQVLMNIISYFLGIVLDSRDNDLMVTHDLKTSVVLKKHIYSFGVRGHFIFTSLFFSGSDMVTTPAPQRSVLKLPFSEKYSVCRKMMLGIWKCLEIGEKLGT